MTFTAKHFLPYVGTVFSLPAEYGPYTELTLEKVNDATKDSSPFHQFSLSFISQAPQALPQGTYRLSHAEDAPLEIFLVPSSKTDLGFRYIASFSVEK